MLWIRYGSNEINRKEKISECISLRVNQRLTLNQIVAKTGVSKATLSVLLRDYKLTKKELYDIRSNQASCARVKKLEKIASEPTPIRSIDYNLASLSKLTTKQKGLAGELRVMQRLIVMGYEVAHYLSESTCDLIAIKQKQICKIQVKTAVSNAKKNSNFNLTHRGYDQGKKRYEEPDFDVLVGYDLRSDTCYVWKHTEILSNKVSISSQETAKEAWHLLFDEPLDKNIQEALKLNNV